jgi:FkbM family methyltransferase
MISKFFAGAIAENSLKKRLRCLFYNIKYHKFFRMNYNGEYYTYFLKNGLAIKSYDSLVGDFAIFIRGYLKNNRPKMGDVIIDAGAYVGAFSIFCSKLVGDEGLILAFEPSKENYKKMLKNIELNQCRNIRAFQYGLWKTNSNMNLLSAEAPSSFKIKPENGKYEKVKMVALDSELKKLKIKKVDFIKIDVVGSELECLEGARKTLEKQDLNLAIATIYKLRGERVDKSVENKLRSLGYKAKTGFPEHVTTYAWK